jgi:hypothetical protein
MPYLYISAERKGSLTDTPLIAAFTWSTAWISRTSREFRINQSNELLPFVPVLRLTESAWDIVTYTTFFTINGIRMTSREK